MGLIDLIKDIPLSAVLKEKIAAMEAENGALQTENAILKDDKRQLEAENERLKNEIKSLTHTDDLSEEEVKILIRLERLDGSDEFENIANALGVRLTRLKYFLESLVEKGYISRVPILMAGQPLTYYLGQKGRKYLIDNGLL